MGNALKVLKALGIEASPNTESYAKMFYVMVCLVTVCENYEKYYYGADHDLDLECETYGEAGMALLMEQAGMEWAEIKEIIKRMDIDD